VTWAVFIKYAEKRKPPAPPKKKVLKGGRMREGGMDGTSVAKVLGPRNLRVHAVLPAIRLTHHIVPQHRVHVFLHSYQKIVNEKR